MKKILFYNISGAIHSNNISEILTLFEYFQHASVSQALKVTVATFKLMFLSWEKYFKIRIIVVVLVLKCLT